MREEEWEGLREMRWEGTQPIVFYLVWFIELKGGGWMESDGDGGVGGKSVGFTGSVLGWVVFEMIIVGKYG